MMAGRGGHLSPSVSSVHLVRLTILALTQLYYYKYRMLILILRTFISALRSHRALALENLALRHQLEVLQRNNKRPRLTNRDRTLWIILSHFWTDWRQSLIFAQPETVILPARLKTSCDYGKIRVSVMNDYHRINAGEPAEDPHVK